MGRKRGCQKKGDWFEREDDAGRGRCRLSLWRDTRAGQKEYTTLRGIDGTDEDLGGGYRWTHCPCTISEHCRSVYRQ